MQKLQNCFSSINFEHYSYFTVIKFLLKIIKAYACEINMKLDWKIPLFFQHYHLFFNLDCYSSKCIKFLFYQGCRRLHIFLSQRHSLQERTQLVNVLSLILQDYGRVGFAIKAEQRYVSDVIFNLTFIRPEYTWKLIEFSYVRIS